MSVVRSCSDFSFLNESGRVTGHLRIGNYPSHLSRFSVFTPAELDLAPGPGWDFFTSHFSGCRGFIGPVPLPLSIRWWLFCVGSGFRQGEIFSAFAFVIARSRGRVLIGAEPIYAPWTFRAIRILNFPEAFLFGRKCCGGLRGRFFLSHGFPSPPGFAVRFCEHLVPKSGEGW